MYERLIYGLNDMIDCTHQLLFDRFRESEQKRGCYKSARILNAGSENKFKFA